MRRRAKVDSNHGEVVAALRKAGWSVISTAPLGCGIPDIFASKDKETWAIEIKDGSKIPSKRQLTDDEKAFASSWQGKYAVVESAEQALAIVGAA